MQLSKVRYRNSYVIRETELLGMCRSAIRGRMPRVKLVGISVSHATLLGRNCCAKHTLFLGPLSNGSGPFTLRHVINAIHRPLTSVAHAREMPKTGTRFERHLNSVILLLAGFASLVALGFTFIEGFWNGVGVLAMLLIIVLVAAAVPSKGL